MDSRIAHLFRILRLGLATVAGAAAALTLGVRRSRSSQAQAAARQRIHRACQWYSRLLEQLDLVQVEVVRANELPSSKPALLVANHPSLVDIMALLALLPDADCIVNAALARRSVFAGAVRAAGYIQNDGGASVIRRASRSLADGRNVVVFPEGTRSPPGGLGPFRRGAAHIALMSGSPVVPIFIRAEPPGLTKNRRWWHIPRQTMKLTLRVGDPIQVSERVENTARRSQAAHVLTEQLRVLFLQELATERTTDGQQRRP